MGTKLINFREGRRFYEIDGKKYISVSSVLSMIRSIPLERWRGKVGNEEADRISSEAAAIGSATHYLAEQFNLAEAYPERGIKLPAVGEQLRPLFEAYVSWFLDAVDTVIGAEVTSYSPTWGYAGTCDLICILKGDTFPAVVDLKVSNSLGQSVELQLSAYREAIAESLGIDVKRRLVVQIDKVKLGKSHVHESQEHDRAFQAFLHALGVWRYFNG